MPVSEDDPAAAIAAAVGQLLPKLTNATSGGSWDPKAEAQQDHEQGMLLASAYRLQEALPALLTASALEPQNAEYVAESFFVAYQYAVFSTQSDLSDVELAEMAARTTWHLTRARVHSESNCMNSLGGYLSSRMSTRDARARQINAGTRKVFADKLYSRYVPGIKDQWCIGKALIAADTASEALHNVESRVAGACFSTG